MNLGEPSRGGPAPRPPGGRLEALATGVARALLVVLAFVLPFEAPLCRVGPLQLTTVEVALYATLAAWGVATALAWLSRWPTRDAAARFFREPLVAATLAWTAVLFGSAFTASSYRAAAIKFSLRSLSGVLVFFAARSLAGRRDRVLLALVAGGAASAVTAVLELLVPSTAAVWALFREVAFSTFTLPRATGVFGYPTIGGMYWEAVLPLVVVAAARTERRGSRGRAAAAAMAGCALLVGAIVASGTRSSLAGVAVVCSSLFLLGRGWNERLLAMSLGALGVLVATPALAIAASGGDSLLAQRLRFWEDAVWFGVEYRVPTTPRSVAPGEALATSVTLQNTGTLAWHRAGPDPTRLVHRWYLLDGARGATLASRDPLGDRTDLPADVPAGGRVSVSATAQAPTLAGRYALAWDLVEEHVAWFSERGNGQPAAEVDVGVPAGAGIDLASADLALLLPPNSPPHPGRLALWGAAVTLFRDHPLLGVGPDSFRRLYEPLLSPAPTGRPYTDARIHANSLYFETLADLGLSGVFALLALMAALVHASCERRRARDVVGLGFGVAAAAFFVHGASDYFLEFTPTFGLFWLLLGITASAEPVAS